MKTRSGLFDEMLIRLIVLKKWLRIIIWSVNIISLIISASKFMLLLLMLMEIKFIFNECD